jgi:uncharacterized protein YdaT
MRKVVLERKNLNNQQIESYTKAVKKGMSSQHVLPVDGNWAVKRAGSSRASKVFDTQKEAIKYGEKIAKDNKSDLFIHSTTGRIRRKR